MPEMPVRVYHVRTPIDPTGYKVGTVTHSNGVVVTTSAMVGGGFVVCYDDTGFWTRMNGRG